MGMTLGIYLDDNPHASGQTADVNGHPEIERIILTGSEEARTFAADLDKAEYAADAWEDLIADPDVDAVMMLTDNLTAGQRSLEAVQAGKYVYSEKPGARTAEDMAKIVAACEETGAHLVPCYCRRTFPDVREIKRLIEAGAIGELWSFQATWITSTAAARGADNWYFDAEIAGGGMLYWLGCHWLDQLKFVTGRRVEAVSAMVRSCNPEITVEDLACLNLRVEGGAVGSLRVGYLRTLCHGGYSESDLMTAYEGSAGAITQLCGKPSRLELQTRAEEFWHRGEKREVEITITQSGYATALLSDFLRAARERTEPMMTADDALYVLRVAEAAYESSRTGREVSLQWQSEKSGGA